MIVARNLHATTRTLRRAGFTLMEVMVVAAILVILAGVGSIAIFHYLDEAKIKTATAKIHTLETAIADWKLSHGGAPPTSLQELATVQPGKATSALSAADLLDPWEQQYQYSPNQQNQKGMPLISTTVPGTATVISNATE